MKLQLTFLMKISKTVQVKVTNSSARLNILWWNIPPSVTGVMDQVRNTFQYIWRLELQWGSSILEVQDYGVMERVWSRRDLASTYVLRYYHILVPNFGGQSIRVWLEVQTKEENLRRTMSQEELMFKLPICYRTSYILIVWEWMLN